MPASRDRPVAIFDPEKMTAIVADLRQASDHLVEIIAMTSSGRQCQDIVEQIARASAELDHVGFALVAAGLRQCLNDPDGHPLDSAALTKLFLSLA